MTNGSLNYIHANLWGLARNHSHSGARCFLSIVDDYSIKLWIFTQKTKDEVFKNFKSQKTLIKNQTDRKVKRLMADNGLELYNEAFNNYSAMFSISRHNTVADTPQQNDLDERFIERVKCMLISD